MNDNKIKELKKELDELPTIKDKLVHWKNNFLDKYTTSIMFHEYFETKSGEELGTNNDDGFYGPLLLPMSGKTNKALVPQLDIRLNKLNDKERIKYYRWMLYFLAERRFKQFVKPALEKQLNTPLGKEKLIGRFNKILKIQQDAKSALRDGSIKIEGMSQLSDKKLFLWYADDYYSRVEIPITVMENPHVEVVCEHHYVYPYLKEHLKPSKKEDTKKQILKLVGIDIPKLVSALKSKKYFDDKDEHRTVNWFKGIPVKEPIQINKPMSHFASLIADLKESGFIKNNKTFCKNLIHSSLLFENECKSLGSIKNALNENAPTRIHKNDKGNYIDIKDFIKKN